MRDCRIGHELICQCTKSWKSRNSPANKARSTRCAVCSLQSAFYYDRFPMLSTWFTRTSGNVSQNMELLSLRSTSWGVLIARVMMNMLAIRFFPVMLETEESISEIDGHHLLQGASDLWSCNETGSWQFEVTGALWYGIVWLYNFAVQVISL